MNPDQQNPEPTAHLDDNRLRDLVVYLTSSPAKAFKSKEVYEGTTVADYTFSKWKKGRTNSVGAIRVARAFLNAWFRTRDLPADFTVPVPEEPNAENNAENEEGGPDEEPEPEQAVKDGTGANGPDPGADGPEPETSDDDDDDDGSSSGEGKKKVTEFKKVDPKTALDFSGKDPEYADYHRIRLRSWNTRNFSDNAKEVRQSTFSYVVARSDICAIQEMQTDLEKISALRIWERSLSDYTILQTELLHGNERLAMIYKTKMFDVVGQEIIGTDMIRPALAVTFIDRKGVV